MKPPPDDPRPATARRPRRHDPGRRDRLIDAALTVIAERGVAGTTHREIARVADVPLGSMTYHFASLEEVLAEAFTRHAESAARVFDECLGSARDRTEAVEAVITLVSGYLLGSQYDLVLSVELYVAAARNPALRAVTQAWMARSRRALERHFDATTARELDALIEGLVLHSALSTDPMTPEQIRHAVERFLR
ncbi:TetR/AcrR family transcriptional regulator [Planobispora takensis]|uniref:TetR family transcriptional regulator n=1 Tax=Planobispora takensis TaxID=1367882 RepID=A0A8J3X0E2_9ACTN|nr:TetR family transcriptional regulator [Planobispora takensis]GII05662.1 TetR family transcriptional regulator [Planobispora takensis]